MKTDFYKFRCADGDSPDSAEILIFGEIGSWDEMGEVSAKAFARDLAALPASVKRIDLHINSPGGSLFEAQAIYSRLADHRSTKNVYVDGIAASAATIIAMVGHKIFIRANATMMIHMPSGIVMGNAEDMRQIANALDTVTESMINVYEKRTGLARDKIRDLLTAETWLSPDDAVEHGFADEVRGVVKAAAALGNNRYNFNGCEFDLSRFHNVPAFNATEGKRKEQMKPTATTEGGGETTKTETTKTEPAKTEPAKTETTKTETTKTAEPPKTGAGEAGNSYEDGVKAERSRVTALQKLDRPETHAIVTAAIKDGKTAPEVFEEVMAAMDKAKTQGARHADARQLDGIPPSDGAGDKPNSFGALLKEKVKARTKTRTRPMLHSRS
jgi:ATP-dependent protease ClpP protease subunit